MKSLSLLESLIDDSRSINKILDDHILILTENQLNWKPSADKWSVLECLEHIMLSGQYYIDEINNRLAGIPQNTGPVNLEFKPGLIGNYSVKSMKPDPSSGKITNKMKTFRRMEPGKSDLDHKRILENFNRYQADLLVIIEKLKYYDLNKVRIRSSIGNLIRFNLGDALRFVVAHNQRHIQQSVNVLQSAGFPAASFL